MGTDVRNMDKTTDSVLNLTSVNDNVTTFAVTYMYSADDDGSNLLATIRQQAIKIVYFFVAVVGIVDNVFVVVVFVGFVGISHRKTNLFIINQSCIDLLASLWILLLGFDGVNGTHMKSDSSLDQFVCRVWLTRFPLWATLTSSTANILVLTLERYIAIIYPIIYKQKVNKIVVCVSVIAAWSYGFVVVSIWSSTSSAVGLDGICMPYGIWPSIAVSRVAGFIGMMAEYGIPVFLMVFCYWRMLRTIRTKVNVTVAGNLQHKAGMNVLKTLITVSCCFFGCWTFNEMLWLAFQIGAEVDFSSWYYHISVVMTMSSCIINPFIYAAQYKQFQEACRNLLQNIRKRVFANMVSHETPPLENLGAHPAVSH